MWATELDKGLCNWFIVFQNNSYFKNKLLNMLASPMLSSSSIAYLLASLGDKGLFSLVFSKQQNQSIELYSCCSCDHIFSQYFAQFFLAKRVKCSAILYSLPKQLNLVPRSSRLTVKFLELTSLFIYRTLLGKQWLVTKNYPWDLSQLETEKYFEEIIIPYLYHNFIITRLNAEYFFSTTAEDPARKLWLKREHGTGGQRDLTENGGGESGL